MPKTVTFISSQIKELWRTKEDCLLTSLWICRLHYDTLRFAHIGKASTNHTEKSKTKIEEREFAIIAVLSARKRKRKQCFITFSRTSIVVFSESDDWAGQASDCVSFTQNQKGASYTLSFLFHLYLPLLFVIKCFSLLLCLKFISSIWWYNFFVFVIYFLWCFLQPFSKTRTLTYILFAYSKARKRIFL